MTEVNGRQIAAGNHSVVELLEHLAEMARNEQIHALFIVARTDDGPPVVIVGTEESNRATLRPSLLSDVAHVLAEQVRGDAP